MSRRTMMIAGMSAAVAFGGGYALLGALQPTTTLSQTIDRPTDPSTVVAVPGTALVPLNDGSSDWILIGPDGTVLAGPDGLPPAAEGDAPPYFRDDDDDERADPYPAGRTDERSDRQWNDRYDRDHDHHDDDDDDDDDHEDEYDVRTTSTGALQLTTRDPR